MHKIFSPVNSDASKILSIENSSELREKAISIAMKNHDDTFTYLDIGPCRYFSGTTKSLKDYFLLPWWNKSNLYYANLRNTKMHVFDTFDDKTMQLVDNYFKYKILYFYKKNIEIKNKVYKNYKYCVCHIGDIYEGLNDFITNNPKAKINFLFLDIIGNLRNKYNNHESHNILNEKIVNEYFTNTKKILQKIKSNFVNNAIIYIDLFYNYNHWEKGAYKALNDVFQNKDFIYLAVHKNKHDVCIQIKL